MNSLVYQHDNQPVSNVMETAIEMATSVSNGAILNNPVTVSDTDMQSERARERDARMSRRVFHEQESQKRIAAARDREILEGAKHAEQARRAAAARERAGEAAHAFAECWCANGPLAAKAMLDRDYYAPGLLTVGEIAMLSTRIGSEMEKIVASADSPADLPGLNAQDFLRFSNYRFIDHEKNSWAWIHGKLGGTTSYSETYYETREDALKAALKDRAARRPAPESQPQMEQEHGDVSSDVDSEEEELSMHAM